MKNNNLTLFNRSLQDYVKGKSDLVDRAIEDQRKYPHFNAENKERITKAVFDSLAIGEYPVIGGEKVSSNIIATSENDALKVISNMPHSMNNRQVELRYIDCLVSFTGESNLLYYTDQTAPFVHLGAMYAQSFSLYFYIKKTEDEQDAFNFKTQKNNALHLIKIRLESNVSSFNKLIDNLRADISHKVEKIFSNINESNKFDDLLN
jgi:hypothetical protein